MSDEKNKEQPERSGTNVATESLNDALNTLEGILRPPPEDAGGDGACAAPRTPRPQGENERVEAGEPYTIPLLNDVVVPGATPENEAAPVRRLPPLADDETCRHLVNRLASEIEVIVQTGIEEAMRNATADVTAQVKKHIDIVLPEILDEITLLRSRKNR